MGVVWVGWCVGGWVGVCGWVGWCVWVGGLVCGWVGGLVVIFRRLYSLFVRFAHSSFALLTLASPVKSDGCATLGFFVYFIVLTRR